MDEAACAETTVAVPAGATACSDAQAQQHAVTWWDDPDYRRKVRAAAVCGACVRLALLGTVSYVFVHTVRLASHEPRHVALFAGAHAAVAALFVCLSRCAASRRLKPKPDDGCGWWLCVWFRVKEIAENAAVDLLFCVFGFRVAEAGPPALTWLVVCVMVALSCLFVYLVCRDEDERHQYQAVGEARCDDAAGDSKAAVEKVKSTDEMV